MAEKTRLVSALFKNRANAERAYQALPQYGIAYDQVSVIGPKGEITQASVGQAGDLSQGVKQQKITVGDSAAAGAAAGGAIGVLGGFMLAAGFALIPAIGAVIAGPIAGALIGAGLGGSGTLKDALTNSGLSEYEAEQVEDRVKMGGIVFAVATEAERVSRVQDALRQLGGELIAVEHVAGVR